MRPAAVADTPRGTIVEAARRLLQHCEICEHRCGVDRFRERGICGLPAEARAYRTFVHYGEEPEISPTLAVFVTGCSFRCAYCSDAPQVDRPGDGVLLDEVGLVALARAAAGAAVPARTVSFVGGNPDENLPGLLPVLDRLQGILPLAWNSNLYLAPEALALLLPRVAVLLPDLKFGNDACARQVARAPRYVEVLHRNLRLAHGRVRLIVRHLLMPGHVSCCLLPAARFVADELPEATFNLLTQYEPLLATWPLSPGLAGRPRAAEIEAATEFLETWFGAARLWRDGRPRDAHG